MQAGLAGNIEVLKFLIDNNEIQALNETQDENKRDILMRLILSDNPNKVTTYEKLIKYSETFELKERKHFIINHKDKDGKTVIMHAAEKGEIAIVYALIKKHGYSLLDVKDNEDKNTIDRLANKKDNTLQDIQKNHIMSSKKSQEERTAEVAKVQKKLNIDIPTGASYQLSSDQILDENIKLAKEISLLEQQPQTVAPRFDSIQTNQSFYSASSQFSSDQMFDDESIKLVKEISLLEQQPQTVTPRSDSIQTNQSFYSASSQLSSDQMLDDESIKLAKEISLQAENQKFGDDEQLAQMLSISEQDI